MFSERMVVLRKIDYETMIKLMSVQNKIMICDSEFFKSDAWISDGNQFLYGVVIWSNTRIFAHFNTPFIEPEYHGYKVSSAYIMDPDTGAHHLKNRYKE
jgi:hypothetical protein